MKDQDPYCWSVDQVVEQICSRTSTLRASIAIKSTLDFTKLELALRENDIDGENLLWLEDANVKDDLGISSFGQRRDLRKIVLQLRATSRLYESSLLTTSENNLKRPSSELQVSSPDPQPSPHPKRRRIQPLNISTEPVTNPDDFDPGNLSDQWVDFLHRHPQNSDEDILRPYIESDQSMELDTDDDKSLIAEMDLESDKFTPPPVLHLSREDIDQTINEAIQNFKNSWNENKRPKRYKQARRRWLQAAQAGTRKPQQYILNQELEQMEARLTKFCKAIIDMSSEYHKMEDVKQNCANLQATVEDCAEREYYLEVLNNNDPPERPEEPIVSHLQVEELPEGEELLQSSDTDEYTSESENAHDSNMMDLMSDDDSGVSLPYDPVDDAWNPHIPSPPPQPKQPADVFFDQSSQISHNNQGSAAQQFHLNPVSPPPVSQANNVVSPTMSRSKSLSQGAATLDLPISPPKKSMTQTTPLKIDSDRHDLTELEYPKLDDLEQLPESRYRHHGTTQENAITIASSPSTFDLEYSDHSVNTPPLNPLKVEIYDAPVQVQWPDIETTRKLRWSAVLDDKTALCKAVYGVARSHAKDVLDFIMSVTLAEKSDRIQVQIDYVQDQDEDLSDDDDGKSEDTELLWLRFFVTFLSKQGYNDIWAVPQQHLEDAYSSAQSKLLHFDRLLKPLLQYYISTKTMSAAKNGWKHDASYAITPPTKSSTSLRALLNSHQSNNSQTPTHTIQPHRQIRSKSQDTDITISDSESTFEPSSSSRKQRKRAVQESQEALAQQVAGQTRIQEQEERFKLLMPKFHSQDVAPEDRKVPINTDSQNLVFLDQHIASRIKEHQISGVQFLWREVIADTKNNGALLAHTMGLGKTMQVITFLTTLAQCNMAADPKIRELIPEHLRSGKILVMCPASLIDNWYDELQNWSPPNRRNLLGDFYRMSGYRNDKLRTLYTWSSAAKGILIISYESLRSLLDEKKCSEQELSRMQRILLEDPTIVVADEAHKLKNSKSSTSKLSRKFRTTSRIALTGSPLNNHLEEYHTMIDWIAPEYLGTIVQFRAKYSEPIERGLWEDSTRYERRRSLERLYVLKRDLAPKVDRKDISAIAADMPQKTEFYITIPLTDVQNEIYKIMVQHFLGSIQNGQGQGTAKSSNAQLWSWLAILSWLCNHPSILIQKLEEKIGNESVLENEEIDDEAVIPANIDLTQTPLTRLLPQIRACFENQDEEMMNPNLSIRTLVTQMLIEEAVREGQKTLLFSHSIPTLDFLENMLQRMGVRFLRIDGSTRPEQRQQYTKDFNKSTNSDLMVFLISTRAGGLGLNLQGANRVIIYDFGFNPSWEEQAVGRAYRLGQKQPVFVYKMRAGGTFEDAIYNKSIFKTQLFSRVVDQKNVVRHAKKDVEDYLFIPERVDLADFTDCIGKDELLDRVLARVPGMIRNLILTETFQREDEDDVLTVEERTRADEQVKLESLLRNDPEGYHRLKMQIERRQNAADQAAQAALQARYTNVTPQAAGPLNFEQVFQPSVSNYVQFPGGTPEAVGVARGVQEEPVPEKNRWED